MDQRTRDERRRAKAQRNSRNELSEFEARGLSVKGRIATFPSQRCVHRTDAKEVYAKRKRKDGTTYSLKLEIGGIRCPKTALANKRCLEHLG